ncbi:MAG: radical SAM protein, partial [Candidatus Bathyarchaeia archaeon]
MMCQDGIKLEENPIIEKLISPGGVGRLFKYASEEYGYREREEGYISKCHLCLDIRRHLVEQTDEFKELKPREFYEHL